MWQLRRSFFDNGSHWVAINSKLRIYIRLTCDPITVGDVDVPLRQLSLSRRCLKACRNMLRWIKFLRYNLRWPKGTISCRKIVPGLLLEVVLLFTSLQVIESRMLKKLHVHAVQSPQIKSTQKVHSAERDFGWGGLFKSPLEDNRMNGPSEIHTLLQENATGWFKCFSKFPTTDRPRHLLTCQFVSGVPHGYTCLVSENNKLWNKYQYSFTFH